MREDAPNIRLIRAAVEDHIRLQNCVALVEERRVERRELHGPRDEGLGLVAAELVTQVPQRLPPDLAVGVDLRCARYLPEVAVIEAASAGCHAARTPLRCRLPDLAVDRLKTDQVLAAPDVLADADVRDASHIGLEALLLEEVVGVPITPGLAHRACLNTAQGGEAVLVDYQAVGEAMRVLVVNDPRFVRPVRRDERVTGIAREMPEIHLHAGAEAVGGRRHVRIVDVAAVWHALRRLPAVEGLAADVVIRLEA